MPSGDIGEKRVIQPLREISATTRRLSTYIAGALEAAASRGRDRKARQHILDTIAAMISGTRLRPGRLAIDYVSQARRRAAGSVVGTRLLTSSVHAALANGMLAHADETDDSHAPSRTHPGCAVIPAALAVAESVHASGERLLRAVVLGYDVAARVNYALGPDALAAASRSTHSIGGTFGAGAAAGALLGLDERQVRHLLSFCAQQASGVGCHVRDPEHIEKAFDFGGMPARNGVTAATMVAAGMTGVDDVFSGERNFFEAYAPASRSRTPDRRARATLRNHGHEHQEMAGGFAGASRARCADGVDGKRTDRARRNRIHRGAFAVALRPDRGQCADAQSQRPASHGHAAGRRDAHFRNHP